MSIMRMNRIRPAADPHKPSQMAAALRPIYGEKGDEFLRHLRQFGHVTYAANMTGLTRRTFYDRRARSPEFAEAWDEALDAFEEELTHRVVQTALEMGTGRWVPVVDGDGEPELDDDFEPVFRFETGNVDPRVLNKLLSLRMSSADGPARTTVNVDSRTTVHGALPDRPRLVGGTTGSQNESVSTSRLRGGSCAVEDADVIQGAILEPGGRADG